MHMSVSYIWLNLVDSKVSAGLSVVRWSFPGKSHTYMHAHIIRLTMENPVLYATT